MGFGDRWETRWETLTEVYETKQMQRPDPFEIVSPPVLTLEDLLTSVEVLQQKEREDKAILESIGGMSGDALKNKLLQWALLKCPNVYEILQVPVKPPMVCSDGQERSLADYIVFCSGKSIQDHVADLQGKLSGINVSFANMGTHIGIVVSRS